MKTHKDLDVWVKSIELVTQLYEKTAAFPSHELYGLTNQIRRASVSIPANLAEGAARNHRKEFSQFIGISLGSASEVETLLIISKNLKYLSEEIFQKLNSDLERIIRMLIALKKSLSDFDQAH
jgi:four helix bundle protein